MGFDFLYQEKHAAGVHEQKTTNTSSSGLLYSMFLPSLLIAMSHSSLLSSIIRCENIRLSVPQCDLCIHSTQPPLTRLSSSPSTQHQSRYLQADVESTNVGFFLYTASQHHQQPRKPRGIGQEEGRKVIIESEHLPVLFSSIFRLIVIAFISHCKALCRDWTKSSTTLGVCKKSPVLRFLPHRSSYAQF